MTTMPTDRMALCRMLADATAWNRILRDENWRLHGLIEAAKRRPVRTQDEARAHVALCGPDPEAARHRAELLDATRPKARA